MPRARLNLAALRAAHAATAFQHDGADAPPGTISRRALFGVAGMAVAGASPALRAVRRSALGAVKLAHSRTRAAFLLDGVERWVIDTHRFAGAPVLSVRQTSGQIRIALRGARLPGTDLPANFVCAVRQGLGGWRMHLRLSLGGFAATVPFEPWLAGLQPAGASLRLPTTSMALGAGASVILGGDAWATFTADWQLDLRGPAMARLAGAGMQGVADHAALVLATPADPSILQAPAPIRTFLTLWREKTHPWSLQLAPAGSTWRLDGLPDAFSLIRMEVGEDAHGQDVRGLLAESEAGDATLRFLPHPALKGTDGRPAGLPLRGVRYARAFDAAGHQGVLLARFQEQPVWVRVGDSALEVGDSAETPPFELQHEGDTITALHAMPAVRRASLPLRGAVVEPAVLPAGAHLAVIMPDMPALGTHLEGSAGVVPSIQIQPEAVTGAYGAGETPALPEAYPTPRSRSHGTEGAPAVAGHEVMISLPDAPHADGAGETPALPVGQTHSAEGGHGSHAHPAFAGKVPAIRIYPVTAAPPEPGVTLTLTDPVISVTRPDDLLSLRFECSNLMFMQQTGQPLPQLVAQAPERPSYLAVYFQGQHIAEQAFFQSVPTMPVPANESDSPLVVPDPDSSAGSETPVLPVQRRLAEESRLVFQLPANFGSLPFTLNALLDWESFEQSVAPTALLNGEQTASTVGPPALTETAIEAPWRLILSPNRYAGWLHALDPVSHAGRTELWHTRLGVKITPVKGGTHLYDLHYRYQAIDTPTGPRYVVDQDLVYDGKTIDAAAPFRTVRAIWSPDYPQASRYMDDLPYRMPLTGQDRADLVTLTSDFRHASHHANPLRITIPKLLPELGLAIAAAASNAVAPPRTYDPLPVQVNRLMLSTLGAWLDLHGDWPTGYHLGISLEEWTHRGTMARDHYVRVVYKGYLFPFGHSASLVKVTERTFFNQGGRSVAYLLQRMFIVVREPVKTFGATGLIEADGKSRLDLHMPFKQVQITTITTPDLELPLPIDDLKDLDAPRFTNIQPKDAFWPRVGGQDFQFHLICKDGDGQRTELTAPLAFVSAEAYLAYVHDAMAAVRQDYNGSDPLSVSRRTRPTNGQKVAFAPSNKPGDTTLHTYDITFDAFIPADTVTLPDDQPRFYPIVHTAAASIPPVEALLKSGQKPRVQISPIYLQYGLGGATNSGEVFVELLDTASTLVSFGGGDSSGTNTPGIVNPNFAISAISRRKGPVGGDAARVASQAIDSSFLQDFFSSDAKILGGLPLFEIINTALGSALDRIPTLLTTNLPTEIDTTLTWEPELQPFGPFTPTDSSDTKLHVNARVVTPLNGQPPTYSMDGHMSSFQIELADIVLASFDGMSFSAASGKKLQVKVSNVNVTFEGALAFVNDLKNIIPSDGMSNGPFIDVEPDHVDAGFNLSIPSVGVGIFSLENIALSATVTIPFLGDPARLRFDFCSREHPFLLSVSLFGGGGFFGIGFGLDGVDTVEASFEFGANCSIDLGIASGGVSIMAGIYFKVQKGASPPPPADSVILTGFLRCSGDVDVLGIISVSIEFYMALTYEKDGNESSVYGQASLTISVHIIFFSLSHTFSVERTFAGSHTDPSFADQVSEAQWNQYLAAFA